MDILFLLIPMSVVLVMIIVAVLAWALNSEQFDDLEHQGELIFDEDEAAERAEKMRAAAAQAQTEQTQASQDDNKSALPTVSVARVDLGQRKQDDSTA